MAGSPGVSAAEEVLEDVFEAAPTSCVEAFELVEYILLAEPALICLFGSAAFAGVAGLVVHLSFVGVREYLVGAG